MRTIKILLSILIALALVIIVGIAYVWNKLAFTDAVIVTPNETRIDVPTSAPAQEDRSGTDASGDVGEKIVPEEPFTISIDSIPETQRSVLEALGVDESSFVVTPGMVECAIEALGATRVAEIKEGATPELTEALSLLSCSTR